MNLTRKGEVGGGASLSLGGWRGGTHRGLRGGVAQGMEASRGSARGGGASCVMRGGGETAWEPIPTVVRLAEIENRGGGSAARRGGKGRRHEERSGTKRGQRGLAAL
jgi:hypothetical protein